MFHSWIYKSLSLINPNSWTTIREWKIYGNLRLESIPADPKWPIYLAIRCKADKKITSSLNYLELDQCWGWIYLEFASDKQPTEAEEEGAPSWGNDDSWKKNTFFKFVQIRFSCSLINRFALQTPPSQGDVSHPLKKSQWNLTLGHLKEIIRQCEVYLHACSLWQEPSKPSKPLVRHPLQWPEHPAHLSSSAVINQDYMGCHSLNFTVH